MTEKKKAGRPYKYPFDKLKVGEHHFQTIMAVGQKASILRRNIRAMAKRYEKMHPVKFELKSEGNGVRILRVS